jgi:hypothetical protein
MYNAWLSDTEWLRWFEVMQISDYMNFTNYGDTGTWSSTPATATDVKETQLHYLSTQSSLFVVHIGAFDIVKYVLCAIGFVCNVGGNGLTLTAIRKSPQLRSKADVIVNSLIVADLIISIQFLFYVVVSTKKDAHYECSPGQLIGRAFSTTPTYVSMIHLVVIAVDRYVAIVYPYDYEDRLTDGVVRAMVAATWIVGSVLGCSNWLLLIVGRRRPICEILALDFIWLDVVLYIAVVTIVVSLYGSILKVAWNHHVRVHTEMPVVNIPQNTKFITPAIPGEQPEQQNELQNTHPQQQPQQLHSEMTHHDKHKQAKAQRKEFKAVYLATAVICTFVVLWLPFTIGRALEAAGQSDSYVDTFLNVGNGLGIANSSFNWILYGAVSKKYRRAYLRLLRRGVHESDM